MPRRRLRQVGRNVATGREAAAGASRALDRGMGLPNRIPPATAPGVYLTRDVIPDDLPSWRWRSRLHAAPLLSPEQLWTRLVEAHGPRAHAIVATIRAQPGLTSLRWLRAATSAALGDRLPSFPVVLASTGTEPQFVFVASGDVAAARAGVADRLPVLPFDVLHLLEQLGGGEPAERQWRFAELAARSTG
jgi:hypothetical protein